MPKQLQNRSILGVRLKNIEPAESFRRFSRTKPVRWLVNGSWIWVIGCILVAGIVHILAVFYLPFLATETVVTRLAEGTSVNRLYIVKPEGQLKNPIIPFLAPDIRYAFCHFDLSSGPLHVRAPLPSPEWSIAISNPYGDNFYTVTSAELKRPFVQLLVTHGEQFRAAQVSVAESSEEIVVVNSPEKVGVVVIRAPVPSETYNSSTTEVLRRSRCSVK